MLPEIYKDILEYPFNIFYHVYSKSLAHVHLFWHYMCRLKWPILQSNMSMLPWHINDIFMTSEITYLHQWVHISYTGMFINKIASFSIWKSWFFFYNLDSLIIVLIRLRYEYSFPKCPPPLFPQNKYMLIPYQYRKYMCTKHENY